MFDHSKGVFTETGESLLEVFATTENETAKDMFELGWLPFRNVWFQTRSSRLKLEEISKRRKKELSKITISTEGNVDLIVKKSEKFHKFDAKYLTEYLELPHFKFFFDDCFMGVVNLVDGIPYYTFMIWDESDRKHSYGTLSYYYLIDKFYNEGIDYMYISEFYDQFSYKKTLQGFEFWTGVEWSTNLDFYKNLKEY